MIIIYIIIISNIISIILIIVIILVINIFAITNAYWFILFPITQAHRIQ